VNSALLYGADLLQRSRMVWCLPVAGFGSGVRIADIWDIILINR